MSHCTPPSSKRLLSCSQFHIQLQIWSEFSVIKHEMSGKFSLLHVAVPAPQHALNFLHGNKKYFPPISPPVLNNVVILHVKLITLCPTTWIFTAWSDSTQFEVERRKANEKFLAPLYRVGLVSCKGLLVFHLASLVRRSWQSCTNVIVEL